MSNFLAVPPKRADPLPELPGQLLEYISNHFRDAHPEAFKEDVNTLVTMRKELVESKIEAHPEIAKGLMRYHAQIAFLSTKFPSDIGVSFSQHLPFPSPYSLTPDAAVSLPSLTLEKASALYNIASVYASMAAAERRAEVDGIKRALGFLTAAAGVLDHLISKVLSTLSDELPRPTAAGYDMTTSFLGALKFFVLAEAQECFWQQAVYQGTYKNAVIGKLSMQVSEYYKEAINSANSAIDPSFDFFPQAWRSHMIIKQMHFEAAAQYRLSQEELEKSKYGEEIARLRVAESLAKKGLDVSKKGVADSVIADLKALQAAVKTALDRAVRDNDLVYVKHVPPAAQLPEIKGIAMVKLATPKEVADPIDWLLKSESGMAPLFSGLVPYGVHLALSIYDDRKDTLIRELDGKREELDGLAASTLQSLNLPGSIQALERPAGLPPSLLRKAEEVESGGGVQKIEGLLAEVKQLVAVNRKLYTNSMDILDQEAHESEALQAQHPGLNRQPSHIANSHLVAAANQYDNTMKQAAASDATLQAKWHEWRSRIEILAGGEDEVNDYIPSAGSSTSLPASVRPVRAALEELDDLIAHRAALLVEAKQLASNDDVRPDVLKEATKLAHGGSGDVKTEWFEGIFDKSLEKYHKIQDDMSAAESQQEQLLLRIRDGNEAFIADRQDDPQVKDRQRKLQEMDQAYWKWREISDNAEEGSKFYRSLKDLLENLKTSSQQFINSRRSDAGSITSHMQSMDISSQPQMFPPGPSSHASSPPPSSSPHHLSPPPLSSQPSSSSTPSVSFSLPHPSASTWTSSNDLLPPPPPQPILRSGGIPIQPRTSSASQNVDSPRRVTRGSAASARGPIGDSERNPYKGGTRRGGGGVV